MFRPRHFLFAFAVLLAVTLLLSLCSRARATERAPFDAQATLQRAQVGTYSARLAPTVKLTRREVRRVARSADFDRLECRNDPNRPHLMICEPRRTP